MNHIAKLVQFECLEVFGPGLLCEQQVSRLLAPIQEGTFEDAKELLHARTVHLAIHAVQLEINVEQWILVVDAAVI